MSVYLKDGLVLLQSDLVATDAACCCTSCKTVTLSGLTACCIASFPLGNAKVNTALINGISYTTTGTFGDCHACKFENNLFLHIFDVYSLANCGGTVSFNVAGDFSVFVAHISGNWYVYAAISGYIIFSGSSAGTTISNDVTTCGTHDWDNALIDCLFGPQTGVISGATGGIATLS